MSSAPRTTTAGEYNGPALGPKHGAHPSDMQYIGVALLLGALTAIEVGLYYVKGINARVNTVVLLGLAAVKFFIVAAYFMHLKFETKVFKRLFIGGGILAGFCYIAVLSAFGQLGDPKITWPIYGAFVLVLGSIAMVRNRLAHEVGEEHAPGGHDAATHTHDHADDAAPHAH